MPIGGNSATSRCVPFEGLDSLLPIDGGPEESDWDGRAYAVRRDNRAITLVVVRLRPEGCWWWSWEDFKAARLPAGSRDQRPRRVMEFAWVLESEQRKGLCGQVIHIVARHLGVTPLELGWTLPFTTGGGALVRGLTKGGFWATGDLAAQVMKV